MKFSNPAQKTTGFASIFDSDSIVIHGKVEVAGSNPAISSREKPVTAMVTGFYDGSRCYSAATPDSGVFLESGG